MTANFARRLFAVGLLSLSASMTWSADEESDINDYLVDITSGTVSAAGIVTLDSAITTIQTSQDLVVALQPLSSADKKAAFGLAITPAKTTLTPMSGNTYVKNGWWRLLGNLTVSYAQTEVDLASATYKKQAVSLDSVYFIDRHDDPVYAASDAFQLCSNSTAAATSAKLADLLARKFAQKVTELQAKEEEKQILGARAAETTACIGSEMAKVRWNSPRISASFGLGRIRGNGSSYSLGRHLNVNGQFPVGSTGLVQVTLRRAQKALDTDTLGQAQVGLKASRLAAMRYTYGGDGPTDVRVLAEASNAKSSSASAFRDAFVFAVGVDKKLARGAWLEFRLGRSRVNESGTEQTNGLLSLNIAPSLFEYLK